MADDEWTPLDDLGRTEAGIRSGIERVTSALREFDTARRSALDAMDRFAEAMAKNPPDASELTDEEAQQFAEALDVIEGARRQIENLPGDDGPRHERESDRG